MRPSVSVAMDFRDLLGYQPETLTRGLMLLSPGQRARLRLALDAADHQDGSEEAGMSLITSAEQAVEHVFKDVEAGVEDIDGAALAEARRLLAEAREAEARAVTFLAEHKAEVAALLAKYGPEAVALAEAEFEKLISVFQGLFQLAP